MMILSFCCCMVLHAENDSIGLADGVLDSTQTETLGLMSVEGMKTMSIFTANDSTDHYANGVVLTAFKGKLYCMWQSSP